MGDDLVSQSCYFVILYALWLTSQVKPVYFSRDQIGNVVSRVRANTADSISDFW